MHRWFEYKFWLSCQSRFPSVSCLEWYLNDVLLRRCIGISLLYFLMLSFPANLWCCRSLLQLILLFLILFFNFLCNLISWNLLLQDYVSIWIWLIIDHVKLGYIEFVHTGLLTLFGTLLARVVLCIVHLATYVLLDDLGNAWDIRKNWWEYFAFTTLKHFNFHVELFNLFDTVVNLLLICPKIIPAFQSLLHILEIIRTILNEEPSRVLNQKLFWYRQSLSKLKYLFLKLLVFNKYLLLNQNALINLRLVLDLTWVVSTLVVGNIWWVV